MPSSARDDFSAKIRQALAARAGYRCSFTDCGQLTTGPSGESNLATTSIGEAAHISAASAGGKRYLASMSPVERSGIDNAIWLCATHATLIDRDDTTYTADVLKKMKHHHEERCEAELRGLVRDPKPASDLVAIGPGNVFLGRVTAIAVDMWTFEIHHFLIGNLGSLAAFIDAFGASARYDRYVIANQLGDGRVLSTAPSIGTGGQWHIIHCPVQQRSPRIRGDSLPTDLSLAGGDLSINKHGDLASVSGLDALPQKIELGLSIQRGELLFHRDFGARFAEYYRLFRGSNWLARLFKLEVIRLAAIPYFDHISNEQQTPLLCVERVTGVEVFPEQEDQRVPMRVELEIKGHGRWQQDLTIRTG